MLKKHNGFNLIELVITIVVLGIIGAVAIPNFVDMSEETLSARTRHDGGMFEQNIHSVRAKWFADGSNAATIDLIPGNSVVTSTTTGWPQAGPSVGHAGCADLFNALLATEIQAVGPPFFIGNEEYAALRAGSFCFFIPLEDTTPLRYFRYNSTNGDMLFINA